MEEMVEPVVERPVEERCPRCLQPVPPKASRCPDCGQPIHSLRWWPFAIGAAGVLVLVFALFVLFRSMKNEELMTAPVPVEEIQTKPDGPFPEPPPDSGKPSKPEKKPPLNDY